MTRSAAAAYESVKDRTAGMELEAHCRAQAVQAEAEERVEKARDLFRQGYNCSQSVFLAYNDLLGVESTLSLIHI